MGAALRKGSSSRGDSSSTENVDRRAALQDSNQVTEGSTQRITSSSRTSTTINDNSQRADAAVLKAMAAGQADAVKAMTTAGAKVLENVGGAVVDLNKDTVAAQTKQWDALVKTGAGLVDKLIDANTETTSRAIASYQPVEGANADVAKWGGVAVAAVAAAAILMKGK